MDGFSTLTGIGLIFLFIGLVFSIIGWRFSKLIKLWEPTKGVIVPTNTDAKIVIGSNHARQEDNPTVKYTVNGVTYQSTSQVYQTPRMPIGKQVEERYNPKNPEEVMINTFVQNGTLFKLLGGIFGVVGFILIIVSLF